MSDPASVILKLDSFAVELDQLSRDLADVERKLEPAESAFADMFGSVYAMPDFCACGALLPPYKGLGRPAKWCSIDCREKSKPRYRWKQCIDCGVPVTIRATRCGSCRSRQRKGERAPGWKGDLAGKKAARQRSANVRPVLGVCEQCESRPATHRHHIDENVYHNALENIVALCASCHESNHALQRWNDGGF